MSGKLAMTAYEQRIVEAIVTPNKHVAPHLRVVYVNDLKSILGKIERLEDAVRKLREQKTCNKK